MKTTNLKQLVCNLCSGQYSQSEVVEFINLTQKISLSYLKYQEMMGKRISGDRPESDLELEDLALDCVAELFSRDENLQFFQLKRYYEAKFSEQPVDDAEVLILTRRLVVRKTKQELSRIFRERDPEGAKIVRNIKVAIRSAEKLHTFHDLGREFVFYSNGCHLKSPETEVKVTRPLAQYLRKKLPPIPDEFTSGFRISIVRPIRCLWSSATFCKPFTTWRTIRISSPSTCWSKWSGTSNSTPFAKT